MRKMHFLMLLLFFFSFESLFFSNAFQHYASSGLRREIFQFGTRTSKTGVTTFQLYVDGSTDMGILGGNVDGSFSQNSVANDKRGADDPWKDLSQEIADIGDMLAELEEYIGENPERSRNDNNDNLMGSYESARSYLNLLESIQQEFAALEQNRKVLNEVDSVEENGEGETEEEPYTVPSLTYSWTPWNDHSLDEDDDFISMAVVDEEEAIVMITNQAASTTYDDIDYDDVSLLPRQETGNSPQADPFSDLEILRPSPPENPPPKNLLTLSSWNADNSESTMTFVGDDSGCSTNNKHVVPAMQPSTPSTVRDINDLNRAKKNASFRSAENAQSLWSRHQSTLKRGLALTGEKSFRQSFAQNPSPLGSSIPLTDIGTNRRSQRPSWQHEKVKSRKFRKADLQSNLDEHSSGHSTINETPKPSATVPSVTTTRFSRNEGGVQLSGHIVRKPSSGSSSRPITDISSITRYSSIKGRRLAGNQPKLHSQQLQKGNTSSVHVTSHISPTPVVNPDFHAIPDDVHDTEPVGQDFPNPSNELDPMPSIVDDHPQSIEIAPALTVASPENVVSTTNDDAPATHRKYRWSTRERRVPLHAGGDKGSPTSKSGVSDNPWPAMAQDVPSTANRIPTLESMQGRRLWFPDETTLLSRSLLSNKGMRSASLSDFSSTGTLGSKPRNYTRRVMFF